LDVGRVLAGELGIRVPDPAAYGEFSPLFDRLAAARYGYVGWLTANKLKIQRIRYQKPVYRDSLMSFGRPTDGLVE
jgi:hypothetical protein